jgi:hypothetical protein
MHVAGRTPALAPGASVETTISTGIFCFPSTFGLDTCTPDLLGKSHLRPGQVCADLLGKSCKCTAELHRLLDQRNTLEQSVR